MSARLLALLATPLLAACMHPYTRPPDATALPARVEWPTLGGGRLAIDADALVVRCGLADPGTPLGVVLSDTPDGRVVVEQRLDAASPLRPGDALLAAQAHPMRSWARGLHGEGLLAAASVAEVASRGAPLRSQEDLRGYGLVWCWLDLLVQREGEQVVVRVEVAAPAPIAAQPFRAAETRALGFEACRVTDLPAGARPIVPPAASDRLVLVTRVARGGPAGIAGLRPLDLLDLDREAALLDPAEREQTRGEARARGVPIPPTFAQGFGTQHLRPRAHDPIAGQALTVHRSSRAEPMRLVIRAPTEEVLSDTWLWSIESDDAATHVHAGPLGVLWRYNSRLEYNPRTDRHARSRCWSILTLFTVQSLGGDGWNDWTWMSVISPMDEALFHYWSYATGLAN